ncbi:DUF2079 domain-containing protein [Amycolatopsis taiwanensis]|uniref:DUF2079 domain-containing protein n=2 Tax=Amycolatopsis taiwanensis TaxID=342230 RepID=UPI0025535E0F|nr:DUF2079 domain-containing protein [Amycolatopsis taiwanensis]
MALIGQRGDSVVRVGGRRDRLGVAALWLVAAVPAGLALWTAVRASRFQVLLDYWHVLAKVTADDGTLLPGMVATYHLDQPFVVPSLLFWADAAWFGGDNRVLTVLTVVLLAAVVVLLPAMLPASLGAVRRAALTAGFAFVVFSSHLAELWLQATNGISWVPAVACGVAAIVLAHRGRAWWAWGMAAVACLCFGAGLPVWFAVTLTSAVRRERVWRVATPLLAGLVVVGFWLVTKPSGPQSLATSAVDPDRRLSVFTAVVGGLWSADQPVVAVIAGGVTVAVLVVLACSVLPRPGREAVSGWLGLGAYGLMLAALVALGRTTTVAVAGGNVGLLGRYGLAAALVMCAVVALVAVFRPGLPVRYLAVGVVTVGLVTHAIGGGKQDSARAAYAPLGVAAVALRVEATNALAALQIEPSVIPAARALGDYPFTSDFTLGCGGPELGQRMDVASARPLPGPDSTESSKGVVDTAPVAADSLLSGWAVVDNRPPRCVLVVDGTGTIAGGGVTGLARPDTPQPGWRAVAAPGTTDLTVLVLADGVFYRVDTDNER